MPLPLGPLWAPRRRLATLAVLGCVVGLVGAGPAAADERISVDSAGLAADNPFSGPSAIDADGSVVAFAATAANLVAGDTNGVSDVFVRNRATGLTTRVSVSSDGTQGNAPSAENFVGGNLTPEPAVSADGNVVVFHSAASNLVAGDTNGLVDVFAHDLTTGETTRVDVATGGGQTAVNNPIGFPGEGASVEPAVSADGNTIVFRSTADNLVPADINRGEDIFAHDRTTGATTRVSPALSNAGAGFFAGSARSPQISADGSTVVFSSNLDVVAVALATGDLSRVSTNSAGTGGGNGGSFFPAVSADGRYVSFISIATDLVTGDTNGNRDVFVRDRAIGTTTRVNVSSTGTQANGDSFNPTAISADGRLVAFTSQASTLVAGRTGQNVYTHDLLSGETTWIAPGADPALSADGLTVAYSLNGVFVAAPDTTAPVVTAPADPADAQATSPDGAIVTFGPATATDDVDPDTTAACIPPSGSTFPIGSTVVTCSSTDAAGNTGSDTLTVTVVDTAGPVLDLPADRTVDATGAAGAVVTYSATATDVVDGARTASCVPASGSTFPRGMTTVTCSATDSRGNARTGSFVITVKDATPAAPGAAPVPTAPPAAPVKPAPGATPQPSANPPTVKVTCTSRRVVIVTVPKRQGGRRVRSATATIDGRKARIVRRNGRRTTRVNMRGRGRTTVPVTLTLRLQGGREVIVRRAFRTCRPSRG